MLKKEDVLLQEVFLLDHRLKQLGVAEHLLVITQLQHLPLKLSLLLCVRVMCEPQPSKKAIIGLSL